MLPEGYQIQIIIVRARSFSVMHPEIASKSDLHESSESFLTRKFKILKNIFYKSFWVSMYLKHTKRNFVFNDNM